MTSDLSVPAPQPNPSDSARVDLDEIEADFADPGVVGLRKLGTVGTGPLCRLVAAVPALVAEVRRLRDLVDEFRKRDEAQDRVRELLTRERDAARAEAERLRDACWANAGASAERDAAVAEAARVREALQAVRDLHNRIALQDMCDHADRDACGAWETIDGEWVCGPVVGDFCSECWEDHGGGERIEWPCATVRALDAALDGAE